MARPPSDAAADGPAVLGLASMTGLPAAFFSTVMLVVRDVAGAARLLVQEDLLLLLDDHRPLRAHQHLAVVLEGVGVDRRIGHDDVVALVLRLLPGNSKVTKTWSSTSRPSV